MTEPVCIKAALSALAAYEDKPGLDMDTTIQDLISDLLHVVTERCSGDIDSALSIATKAVATFVHEHTQPEDGPRTDVRISAHNDGRHWTATTLAPFVVCNEPAQTSKRYTLLLNWHDRDRSQGTFSWSGLAENESDAEFLARCEMSVSQPPDLEPESDRELTRDEIMDVGGAVIDITEGAAGHAWPLESALVRLLKAADDQIIAGYRFDTAAADNARETLAMLRD